MTVAGAYEKIEAHEDLCAERYKNIHEKLGDLKGTLNKAVWGIVTVLISVIGWMAVQLWDGTQARIAEMPAAVSD